MRYSELRKLLTLIICFLLEGCATSNSSLLDQLQKSLAEQQDIKAILDLKSQYLYFCDVLSARAINSPAPEYVADKLFTVDGAWIGKNKEGNVYIEYQGRPEIIRKFEENVNRFNDDAGHFQKHFSLNHQIELEGNSATLTAQYLVLHSTENKKEITWISGNYTDFLEKNSEGEWKFKSITSHVEDVSIWQPKAISPKEVE